MPFGDSALERGVIQGMVFDMHRQSFHMRVEAWAFGYGPALKRAVELEAKILVEPDGVVFLHAKLQSLRLGVFASPC